MFFATPGFLTPASAASYDADALAFIQSFNTETGGTMDIQQQLAINNRVLRLKGLLTDYPNPSASSIWPSVHADYPMCPINSTSASLSGFKLNLKDPRDLDAAFRITWLNSPTVSVNGISGNGSSTYGDTHFNPLINSTQNSFGLNNKCITDNTLSGQVEMGIRRGTVSLSQIANRFFSGDFSVSAANSNWGDWVMNTVGNNSKGIFHAERTGQNLLSSYQDGVLRGTNTNNSELDVNGSIYVLARNQQGVGPDGFTNSRVYTSFGLHEGLTQDQVENYEFIINKFDIEAR